MARRAIPKVTLKGVGGYNLKTGTGGGVLMTRTGLFHGRFGGAKVHYNESRDTFSLKLDIVVQDEDNRGAKLTTYKPFEGEKAEFLWEVLLKTGTPKTALAEMEADGRSLDIEEDVIPALMQGDDGGPKECWFTSETEPYMKDGVLQNHKSTVGFFITREEYEADFAIGAHKKPLPPEVKAWLEQRGKGKDASVKTSTPGGGLSSSSGNGATGEATPARTETPSARAKVML